MNRKIPAGIESYKTMIDKEYYYVDKTLMIRDILDSGVAVSLFTRPRRFGKTLGLTMLKTFFEDERDMDGKPADNRHYFAGKKILSCGERYTREMGRYPVIFLTLKSVRQPSFEMAHDVLLNDIRGEFDRHRYVLQSDALSELERKKFLAICQGKATAGEYATALKTLSVCLKKYHGTNVVILLDVSWQSASLAAKYEAPLENAHPCGFYDETPAFIRSLLESALKTNDCLELAVVTGCLRISREGICSGLNNLWVNSILRNSSGISKEGSVGAVEHFGFTTEETRQMFVDYGMEAHFDEAGKWYGGYRFGEAEVYNPWSITSHVSELCSNPEAFPKPYWSDTRDDSIIRELVENADRETKGEIERLIAGKTIEKPVHEDITYGEIHESQDNLWNFLFFTGYLKKTAERRGEENVYLSLTIPNVEIRHIYRNTIEHWFKKRIAATDRTPLYRAIMECDGEKLEGIIKGLLLESISFYDEGEAFYHGFMTGLLGNLGDYLVKSDRESGDGRADLVMEPLDADNPVIIFEFKSTKKLTEMESLCEAALRQIDEKHYDSEHREFGYAHYIKYGICFCRKNCRVLGYRENEG